MIQLMSRGKFRNLVSEKAFGDLIKKQSNSSKGKNIKYGKNQKIAECHLPNKKISLEDQRETFSIS